METTTTEKVSVPNISCPEELDLASPAQTALDAQLESLGLTTGHLVSIAISTTNHVGNLINSVPLASWQRASHELRKRADLMQTPSAEFTARIVWLITTVAQSGDDFAKQVAEKPDAQQAQPDQPAQ